MSDNIEYNSYNNIKRLSDSELENLWMSYLADKTNKKLPLSLCCDSGSFWFESIILRLSGDRLLGS